MSSSMTKIVNYALVLAILYVAKLGFKHSNIFAKKTDGIGAKPDAQMQPALDELAKLGPNP